jgi:uncharacterized protein
MYKNKKSVNNFRLCFFLGIVLVVTGCQANPPQYQGTRYRPVPTGYNTARSNPSRYYPPQQAVPEAPQSPEEQLKMGERYADENSQQRNDVEAVRWFRMAAEGGNAEAQYKLAVMLEHAWGTRRDYQEAMSWYSKAAKQGHAGGQNNIGLMYEKGRGVPIDYNEAIKWYTMAAKKNGGTPNYNIGLLYERGLGVPADKELALKHFNLAANAGYADAQKKLPASPISLSSNELDLRTNQDSTKTNKGDSQTLSQVKRSTDAMKRGDYETTYRLAYPLAQQGNAQAQHNIGYVYDVRGDLQEAIKWYKMAADQNNLQAEDNLGLLYYTNHPKLCGERKNLFDTTTILCSFKLNATALALWRKAAAQGDQWAKDMLAKHQADSERVQQENAESDREWERQQQETLELNLQILKGMK